MPDRPIPQPEARFLLRSMRQILAIMLHVSEQYGDADRAAKVRAVCVGWKAIRAIVWACCRRIDG